MRCVLLGLLVVSCGGPPQLISEKRWESAPPPPVQKKPSFAMREPPLETKQPLQPVVVTPYPPHRLRTCPTDLSLAVARSLDGRRPAHTIAARYAKQHAQPVQREELVDPDQALARILTIEASQPVVVPAGFRGEIVQYGRDPVFRLHMARCELADLHTVRRAGYDAAIAFLLGAPAAEVLPLVKKSIYPDGDTVQSCANASECGGGMTCDPVEKLCRSTKAKVASFLSRPELDIEDLLVRAMATKLTPQMIDRDRYDPDDLLGLWVYGRLTKCDGALCTVTRAARDGKPRLIHRDRRYAGDSADRQHLCRTETRDGCIAKCSGDAGSKRRAACIAACTTLCPTD